MKQRIAILGFGTVGGGVAKIISLSESLDIEIAKILVLKIPNLNDRFGLEEKIFTQNFHEILDDESITTVVELIGGTGAAKTFIEEALNSKKNVVTANKALIAEYGNELFELAEKNEVEIFYEAAVAGSIPIINILETQYEAGGITKISGIMNGTCNFMLSELEKGGVEYADVLKIAQEKGFAEKDPTADVEGIDVAQKIVIASALAFDTAISDWKAVERTGISHLTAQDFIDAKSQGKRIRLLASAEKKTDGKILLKVSPEFVDEHSKFGGIIGAENAVQVENIYTGTSFFAGQGAGSLPTAMAVISDIVLL